MFKCLSGFLISALLWPSDLRAGDVLFQSGKKQVSLIELYSSEGCSSCPPADRWVADLKNNNKLWKEFVPINFHVDYWNRLGWVDRFSTQEFTSRQRTLAGEWGSGRVYTPAFVKNGEEWRSRQMNQLLGSEVGELIVKKASHKKIEVFFKPVSQNKKKLKVHLALLGNGLSTEVKYGENAGETLYHEFVVLKHESKALEAREGAYRVSFDVPENKKAGASNFSLAVWVSAEGSEKPLQATGGPLASL